MSYSKRTKNGIKRSLKKGVILTALLTASIPAYNLGTPIDYIKCLIFDECVSKEEA